VASFPGSPDKVEYQIAVVKVDDPILNAKGLKEVRVGFVPPPPPGHVRPGGIAVSLTEDVEALLFLTKQFDADFYVVPVYFDVVKKANNTNFDKDVEETKKAAKLIADPTAGLKAKDADDRFLTAAMLIDRYRTQKPPYTQPPKEEPIDAAQSKLILEALRDADWAPPAKPRPGIQLTPQSVFYRLGLTADDKWNPPQDNAKFADAAKEWLKDNAGNYRIKQYVADKEEKKEPEKKDK